MHNLQGNLQCDLCMCLCNTLDKHLLQTSYIQSTKSITWQQGFYDNRAALY